MAHLWPVDGVLISTSESVERPKMEPEAVLESIDGYQ